MSLLRPRHLNLEEEEEEEEVGQDRPPPPRSMPTMLPFSKAPTEDAAGEHEKLPKNIAFYFCKLEVRFTFKCFKEIPVYTTKC